MFGQEVDDIPLVGFGAQYLGEPHLRFKPVYLTVDKPVTDDDLRQLSTLLPCKNLTLMDCTAVTEAGLLALCRMRELEELHLMNFQFSGGDLASLKHAESLRALMLKGQSCTDSALSAIGQLDKVNRLELVETSVSHRGLRNLADMEKLSWLFISSSHVDDSMIDVIASMRKLQCVDLCSVGLEDEHLTQLSGLPNLKYLQLYNNPITDDGLAAAQNMANLVWIDLRKTKVSGAAIGRSTRTHPHLEIDIHTETRFAEPRLKWEP